MVLSELQKGQTAFITELDIRGNMRRRLFDMGFIKGGEISCIGASPFGDPRAYMIKDTLIALRKSEASRIRVTI